GIGGAAVGAAVGAISPIRLRAPLPARFSGAPPALDAPQCRAGVCFEIKRPPGMTRAAQVHDKVNSAVYARSTGAGKSLKPSQQAPANGEATALAASTSCRGLGVRHAWTHPAPAPAASAYIKAIRIRTASLRVSGVVTL